MIQKKARVFVRCSQFQPSPVFQGKAKANPEYTKVQDRNIKLG
jgi:hypothetical protein